MGRKKYLKVSGNKIVDFDVSIKNEKNPGDNSMVAFVFLEVETEDDVFKYRIGRDTSNPDLSFTEKHIRTSMAAAMSDYSNVGIKEDSERNRLFYEVQGFRMSVYPGRRI